MGWGVVEGKEGWQTYKRRFVHSKRFKRHVLMHQGLPFPPPCTHQHFQNFTYMYGKMRKTSLLLKYDREKVAWPTLSDKRPLINFCVSGRLCVFRLFLTIASYSCLFILYLRCIACSNHSVRPPNSCMPHYFISGNIHQNAVQSAHFNMYCNVLTSMVQN